MRYLTRLVFALFVLIAPFQASAWNNIGHMTVAYVAWQNLDVATKTKATALIKLNPLYQSTWVPLIPADITGDKRDMYLFMIAATWPDQIKSMTSEFKCNGNSNTDTAPSNEVASLNTGYDDPCMHKYWHFIDISLGSPVHATPKINGDVKIEAFAKALASNEADPIKSYDLVWIEHLVGDLHQPLHCVTRYSSLHPSGDGGANSVKIKTAPEELHGYWDDILGNITHSLYTDATLAEQVATALPALDDADATLAADSISDHWAMESFTYAQTTAYVSPIGPEWGPYSLNPTYHDNAFSLAQKRVTFAGIRLSNLLKTALAAPASS